eukprot:344791_1
MTTKTHDVTEIQMLLHSNQLDTSDTEIKINEQYRTNLIATVEQQPSKHQPPMPIYIFRAIWFRSNDEILERLVDDAVRGVLEMNNIWTDPEFISNIYDDKSFSLCVEQIFKSQCRFFDQFVNDTYKRELQLNALNEQFSKNETITRWLQNYLLSTETQRLYFWSYILCIAVKIKQISI